MSLRHGLLCCCLLYVGIPSWSAGADDMVVQANRLWEKGQQTTHQGRPDEPVAPFEKSLGINPASPRCHLSLAAAFLEKNDAGAACQHLGKYLEAYPENVAVRARYAELLAGLHRPREARAQYEMLIACVQDLPGPAEEHLVSPHTRLVEIAEAYEDAYGEHLHRGIALWLLARRRDRLAGAGDELSVETLLCKAAAELTLASWERPREARPCLYLYQVWSQLGQQQPALCRLRQAEEAAPFSYLTPWEQRSLQVALHDRSQEFNR